MPSPPTRFYVSGFTPEAVTLQWDTPEKFGGTPITEYVIEMCDMKSSPAWSIVAQTLEKCCTIPNLSLSKKYSFRVKAVNAIGQSEPTEIYGPVTPQHEIGRFI